jgi:two-component system, probable response regulator PhcQ
MTHRVLLVDDEPSVRNGLQRVLRKEKYQLVTAQDAAEAFTMLRNQSIDVVISDQNMPGMQGTEFLAQVRLSYPDTIRMMLTGQACIEVAIKAINEGQIYRFFTKPCNHIDLAVTIRHALEQKDLLMKSRRLLEVFKRQAAVIDQMEKEQPGITRLRRDAQGNLLIAENIPEDREAFLKELQEEIDRAQVQFEKTT